MKEAVSRAKGKARAGKVRNALQDPIQYSNLARPFITLLTDFGPADYFAGAMKGTILSINPQARIIDVSHGISAQDIESAAFTLLAGFSSFPAGTIHVAVVDPGVGSGRRPILVQAGNYSFVGPDNGIFSYICDIEPGFKCFHLSNDKYFRQPVSATFHGRDIFSPIAAVLSLGVDVTELGEQITNPVRLPALHPERLKNGNLKGRVIHIDHFGNCITNIGRDDFTEPAQLKVAGKTIKSFKRFFAEEGREKLFGVWGSAGFLEISANNSSAAEILGLERGERVLLSKAH